MKHEDWQRAFHGNVMRTGMVLALTQPMLEYLCAVADGVLWDRFGASALGRPDNFLASSRSLEKRGLIVRKRPVKITDGYVPGNENHWMRTPAGEAVVSLLKAVGVFVEADRAIEKKAKVLNAPAHPAVVAGEGGEAP